MDEFNQMHKRELQIKLIKNKQRENPDKHHHMKKGPVLMDIHNVTMEEQKTL
jgi:hypothetical protein